MPSWIPGRWEIFTLVTTCTRVCVVHSSTHSICSLNRYKTHSFVRGVLILVFDGSRCPYKKCNADSERKRQQAIRERDAARNYLDMERALKKLVCIDADVLYWVKKWVTARKLNDRVFFFGALFETDTQLVQLECEGIVDCIITDDGMCHTDNIANNVCVCVHV